MKGEHNVYVHPLSSTQETTQITMVSTTYWKLLEDTHRQLTVCLGKLRSARTTGDSETLKHAEMDYFQALQALYTTAEDAANASMIQDTRRQGQ